MAQPPFDYESRLEDCARQDERAFQALYQQEARLESCALPHCHG
jgi:RNA polymerase sigma-70 factor (ECF subfamily)